MNIFIDPGHGGKDPGATSLGYLEKDLALAISKKLGVVLDKDYGHEVKFTRLDDIYVGLTERCDMANRHGADLFVSIHLNADPDDDSPGTHEAKGSEIWCYPGAKRSRAVAESLAREIRSRFPDEPFRGVKEDDMAVLRMTTMPAVLIEVGFIDNSTTVRHLSSELVQELVARCIGAGVDNAKEEL